MSPGWRRSQLRLTRKLQITGASGPGMFVLRSRPVVFATATRASVHPDPATESGSYRDMKLSAGSTPSVVE
jgi:hypothetical protein